MSAHDKLTPQTASALAQAILGKGYDWSGEPNTRDWLIDVAMGVVEETKFYSIVWFPEWCYDLSVDQDKREFRKMVGRFARWFFFAMHFNGTNSMADEELYDLTKYFL